MVLEVIKKRKSIRSYLDKKIPQDVLNEIMEAARLSPSASNRQPRKFIIVQDKEMKQKIMQASVLHGNLQPFIADASAILVACGTYTTHIMPGGVHSFPVDVAISLDHISLQAAELGLGTCWIGAFSQEKIKELLGIPENVTVVCLMTLGYPAAPGMDRGRKKLEEIICYEYYKE